MRNYVIQITSYKHNSNRKLLYIMYIDVSMMHSHFTYKATFSYEEVVGLYRPVCFM